MSQALVFAHGVHESRRREVAASVIYDLAPHVPTVCELLEADEQDPLAFMAVPGARWSTRSRTQAGERTRRS